MITFEKPDFILLTMPRSRNSGRSQDDVPGHRAYDSMCPENAKAPRIWSIGDHGQIGATEMKYIKKVPNNQAENMINRK
jgi:hypothetical protein